MPFTLTRHTADIRVGMFTIKEKWEIAETVYPTMNKPAVIPANIIPGPGFFSRLCETDWENVLQYNDLYRVLSFPWQISMHNDWALRQDFLLATMGKSGTALSSTVRVVNGKDIFCEPGVIAEHCYINATNGPIYIASGAEIMEGAMLRGPLFLGPGTVVKMGTSIYGATSIGPQCLLGGEIKNSVIFGYSNKAHEGYLGDAVIGEWCNLGAGTSCSNIRNSASPVKVWMMDRKLSIEAGLKCGLLMADYSRCSINSSFNTGTVVGVCANIFKPGSLLPKFIPSFSWGPTPEVRYTLEKAITDIDSWMKFKGKSITNEQVTSLHHIFSLNEKA